MNLKKIFLSIFLNFLLALKCDSRNFNSYPDNNLQSGQSQGQSQGGYSQSSGIGGYNYHPPQSQRGYNYQQPNNPLVYPGEDSSSNLSNANQKDQKSSSKKSSSKSGRGSSSSSASSSSSSSSSKSQRNSKKGQKSQSQSQSQSSSGQRPRSTTKSPKNSNGNANGSRNGNGNGVTNGQNERQSSSTSTTVSTPTSSRLQNEDDENQNLFNEGPSEIENLNANDDENLGLISPDEGFGAQENANLEGFEEDFEANREIEGQVAENEAGLGGRLNIAEGISGERNLERRQIDSLTGGERQNEEGSSTNIRTARTLTNFNRFRRHDATARRTVNVPKTISYNVNAGTRIISRRTSQITPTKVRVRVIPNNRRIIRRIITRRIIIPQSS